MFVLVGLFGMLLFILVRPQELDASWAGLPSLQVFALLAAVGWMLDVRRLNTRTYVSPQLPLILGYVGWAIFSILPNRSDTIAAGASSLLIVFLFYALIAFGCQSFRKLGVVSGLYLAGALFITTVVVLQGFGSKVCFEEDPRSVGDFEALRPDGRPCEQHSECRGSDAEPGKTYRCENLGPFNTSSVGSRVRYVGRLNDPNETSLAVAVAVPIAFAFFSLKRNLRRRLLVAATVVGVGLAVFFSKSRGGQLVFASVFAVYLYRRNGWKGLLAAGILAAPIMIFGGRSGEEAEGSSLERLECWATGMALFRDSPIWGIGAFRFTDHHFLTAHNSYVLASAETGFVGIWLFIGMLYVTGKILVEAMRAEIEDPEVSHWVKTWALALFATFAGMVIGIFFLSFAYHFVLWIVLGIIGAFYGATKAHVATFAIELRRNDYFAITALTVAIVSVLIVYTRLKAP